MHMYDWSCASDDMWWLLYQVLDTGSHFVLIYHLTIVGWNTPIPPPPPPPLPSPLPNDNDH